VLAPTTNGSGGAQHATDVALSDSTVVLDSDPNLASQPEGSQQARDGADSPAAEEPTTPMGSDGGQSTAVSAAPSSRYGVAAAAADTDRARVDRLHRREVRQSRAAIARVEREKRVANASLELQQEIRRLLEDVRNNVHDAARLEVDGVRANVPRGAMRLSRALSDYTRKLLTQEIPIVPHGELYNDEKDRPVFNDDQDSGDEGEGFEQKRLESEERRPLLPPEAGLQLLAHDLIVMLRWELSPATLGHRELGPGSRRSCSS
jgi:hypothetical protein